MHTKCWTSNSFFSGSTFDWLWHFSSSYGYACTLLDMFQFGFNTILAPPVCIVRTKWWKIVMKCQIAMFLTLFFLRVLSFSRLWHFISPYSDPVNPIFAVLVLAYKIQIFERSFFPRSNRWYNNWEIAFFLFLWQPLLGK